MDAWEIEWHHGQTLAAGQVAEFKVWAELVRQSAGGLHVFLPLRDVGIDAVLHRLADGEYLPVQVKGRMSLTASDQVHITVTASSLVDNSALLIGTLIDGPSLGEFVLVVSEADFKRLPVHDWVGQPRVSDGGVPDALGQRLAMGVVSCVAGKAESGSGWPITRFCRR